jgi:hypothetical protein
MKKALLVIIPLLLLGAAGAWWYLGQPRGEKPGFAAELSAEHTVFVAGALNLHEAAAEVLKAISAMPADQQAAMGPAGEFAKSAEQRKKLMGFDPAEASGWAETGIDPAAGFAMVFDARVFAGDDPMPIVMFKETDRAKTLAFIEARSGEKPTITEGNPGMIMKGDQLKGYLGKRGAYTVLVGGPTHKLEKVKDGVTQFLTGKGGLDADPTFGRALDGAKDLRMFVYAGSAGGSSLVSTLAKDGKLPDSAKTDIQFFLDRFTGVGSWVGQSSSGMRLVASESGAALLGKLFVPAQKPPKFSAYIPNEGWSALRSSVNLNDLFTGIGDALPPSAADKKQGLTMAPMMLAMVAGFSYDDVKGAFSGHMALAADPASFAKIPAEGPGAAKGLVLIGVADEAKADAMLPKLLDLAKKGAPDLEVAAVEIEGAKGHSVAMKGLKAVAVRDGDVVVVGLEAEVKAAIARKKAGEGLKFDAGKSALDDAGVVYGVHYDMKGIAALMGQYMGGASLKGLPEAPLAGAMRADKHGLFMQNKDMGFTHAIGMAAAIAVPAFQKYLERSREIGRHTDDMQKAELEQLEKAREAAGLLAVPPGALPAPAGEVVPAPAGEIVPAPAVNDDEEKAPAGDEAEAN